VVTGSNNFSWAAQNANADNVLTIIDRKLAAMYRANWLKRASAFTAIPDGCAMKVPNTGHKQKICRDEILARPDVATSNQIFDTLADWNQILKDIPAAPDP
jgi:phosphatidylserine/phosphatidylglycerophosphate/cardiolipin synthase-like enzyme